MAARSATTKKAARSASGIIRGLNKGHKTTMRQAKVSHNARLALPKKRLRAVKTIIHDLVGLTPLEKRVQEMLRVGKEKRALKLCKKRLGNMTAAKKTRVRVEDLMRTAAQKKK